MVERRQLRLAEPFDQSEDARVDHSDGEIFIGRLKVMAPSQVGVAGVLDPVRTGKQVIEETEPDRRREPLVAPIVELGENQGRDDKGLACPEDGLGAAVMVGIGGVEAGQQDARVEDQCQLRGRCGDRRGRGLGRRGAVGRPAKAEPRRARLEDRRGLVRDSLGKDAAETLAPPLCLVLEDGERLGISVYRSASIHASRC